MERERDRSRTLSSDLSYVPSYFNPHGFDAKGKETISLDPSKVQRKIVSHGDPKPASFRKGKDPGVHPRWMVRLECPSSNDGYVLDHCSS